MSTIDPLFEKEPAKKSFGIWKLLRRLSPSFKLHLQEIHFFFVGLPYQLGNAWYRFRFLIQPVMRDWGWQIRKRDRHSHVRVLAALLSTLEKKTWIISINSWMSQDNIHHRNNKSNRSKTARPRKEAALLHFLRNSEQSDCTVESSCWISGSITDDSSESRQPQGKALPLGRQFYWGRGWTYGECRSVSLNVWSVYQDVFHWKYQIRPGVIVNLVWG